MSLNYEGQSIHSMKWNGQEILGGEAGGTGTELVFENCALAGDYTYRENKPYNDFAYLMCSLKFIKVGNDVFVQFFDFRKTHETDINITSGTPAQYAGDLPPLNISSRSVAGLNMAECNHRGNSDGYERLTSEKYFFTRWKMTKRTWTYSSSQWYMYMEYGIQLYDDHSNDFLIVPQEFRPSTDKSVFVFNGITEGGDIAATSRVLVLKADTGKLVTVNGFTGGGSIKNYGIEYTGFSQDCTCGHYTLD